MRSSMVLNAARSYLRLREGRLLGCSRIELTSMAHLCNIGTGTSVSQKALEATFDAWYESMLRFRTQRVLIA